MSVRRVAKRMLTATEVGTQSLVYPGYRSFDDGDVPEWWSQVISPPEIGSIIGAHEEFPDVCSGSILIGENGLAVLRFDASSAWLRYIEIDGWDLPEKRPGAQPLVVRGIGGRVLSLPFRLEGLAFAFVQFLGKAIWTANREAGRK